jgi:hypothetical protein
MIGKQEIGRIEGAVISAVYHEGLTATYNGKPAYLAIVDENGKVIVSGNIVAQEAQSVILNCYRNFLNSKGFLRVHSEPINTQN